MSKLNLVIEVNLDNVRWGNDCCSDSDGCGSGSGLWQQLCRGDTTRCPENSQKFVRYKANEVTSLTRYYKKLTHVDSGEVAMVVVSVVFDGCVVVASVVTVVSA